MSGGGGPFIASVVLVAQDGPVAVVFGQVVSAAQGMEVAGAGGSGREGHPMVEVAAPAGAPAAGEHTLLVAGDDESGQVWRWPVGAVP